jgi:hypothetical protein
MGLWDVEASSLVDSRFADGGKAFSLTCRPTILLLKKYFWYSLLLHDTWTQGINAVGGIRSIENTVT